jgi:amino acid adenylation domain-containing protein
MSLGVCAPLQERMWFLQQLIPQSGPAFNVTTATRLRGPIELDRLNAALIELVNRHETLRTGFATEDGRPVRRVAARAVLAALVHECTEAQLPQALSREAMHAFDLAHGPLARATLLRLAPHDNVLVLCLSHAAADGWSMGVLHRELGMLYTAPDCLPAPEYGFTDWLAESAARADQRREREVQHWRAELAGAPEALVLPADRARPAIERYAGLRERCVLPAGVAELVRAMEVTPFAVHMAAFGILLHHWSGERDIVIGTPFANRRSVAQETVVGPLMDLLPIRLTFGASSTVEDVLREVRRRTVRAMANSATGFDGLVKTLHPAREAGRHPLFQALFLMQNAPLEPVCLPGCDGELVEVMPPTARLDVALDVSGDVATFECNRDLVDPALASLLGARYLNLLRQMVTDPSRRVADLDPLAPGETVRLKGERVTWGGPALLHELVAQANPDALAIESEQGSLTYGELWRRSGEAARGLAAAGVTPGSVVCVRMPRAPEQIVALLAVLRAGAAYLPLDPDYPEQRLAEIAVDSGAALVLTALAELPRGDAELPAVDPDDVAYVIYTSGSTGKPKGVMVSHRSAANIVHWGQSRMPLRPTDRMLGKTPFTFDISVWEIFGTLAAGATLVLAAPGRHRDSSYVGRLIADAGITVTHFVPSMLRGVLAVPGLPAWPALRLILAGGEALPAELARRLAGHCPVPVENFYGPTEATVYVSHHLAGDRACANGTVPIGRPVANTAMYVLDAHLRPVPVGARGELFLGGVQVAAGYLGRPGLTATRFLPDPYGERPGARMYRTGDTVRLAADGAMDFLGRDDGQVKLRGFRVELGEVEAALLSHPAVTAAAASVRADALVAHVVSGADAARLREHLAERLPPYMVPARFGLVPELPLTTSGKLDRNRLATLPLDSPQTTVVSRAPQGTAETVIAEVWKLLLGEPVRDAAANFFELGGDSITSVAVVAECVKRGWRLTVQQVFEHATVSGLGRLATPCQEPAAQAEPEVPEGALGPMQQYAVQRVMTARLPGLYVVCFTAAIDGDGFDEHAWRRTWEELMRRHEGLRTSFTPNGTARIVHDELPLPWRGEDLRHLPESEALQRVHEAEEAQRWHTIEVTDAPQWTMRLFRIGEDSWRIICRLSYLLQDGWSVSVLQDEWYPLYDAYRGGHEPQLPPPPPPYATQLRHLAARDLTAGREYWAKRVTVAASPPTVSRALRGRCRPGAGPEHQTVPRWLTPPQERAIRDVARRERVALFAALQGAWAILLAGVTGHEEVLFGTISSGRSTPDVAHMYGSFNNMMPTQVRVRAGDGLSGFLHALQAAGIDDRDNDHVPLPLIAADLGLAHAVDLVDTYIVHENFPIDRATQARFARWKPDIAEMRTEHALRMLIWPVGELSLHLSYDARILGEPEAALLMDSYVGILEAMTTAADLSRLIRDPFAAGGNHER